MDAIQGTNWSSLTACGGQDGSAVPGLIVRSMRNEQESLWAFEQLAMLAENQGSVVEVTLPLVPILQHLAVEAQRESVRLSARSLLVSLASTVYGRPYGELSQHEERERKQRAIEVALASAEALQHVPEMQSSTDAHQDYAWLEQERRKRCRV